MYHADFISNFTIKFLQSLLQGFGTKEEILIDILCRRTKDVCIEPIDHFPFYFVMY
jgi:hypothetical protein